MEKDKKIMIVRSINELLFGIFSFILGAVFYGSILYLNTNSDELVTTIRALLILMVIVLFLYYFLGLQFKIHRYIKTKKDKYLYILRGFLTLLIIYVIVIPILNKLIGVTIFPALF